jgi:hypothetical protein
MWIGSTTKFSKNPSYRFESCPDYTGYLIPGSRVTTIGEFGMSREWWCKVRGTYNGGVPKTKETRHMGDHMLVQISTFFKIKKKYYDTTTVIILYIDYICNKKKTINFSSHTAVRWAKLYTIPRCWE